MGLVIQLTNAGQRGRLPHSVRTAVWVKPSWSAAWRLVPFLRPVECTESVSPGVSAATFEWFTGTVSHPERGGVFEFYSKLEIRNWFIACEAFSAAGSFPVFFGVVENSVLDVDGANNGKQSIKAYGLEYLWSRRRFFSAYTEGGVRVDRTLTFNQRSRSGPGFSGNRASASEASISSGDVYAFGNGGALWSNLDVVNHLLHYYAPTGLTWRLSGQYSVLGDIYEEHEFAGLDLKSCLDRLMASSRGLGYRIMTEGSGVVRLHVFSRLRWGLRVGGVAIPANPAQGTLFARGYGDVRGLLVTESGLSHVDRIVVESSEPIKVAASYGLDQTVSLQAGQGLLEPGWSSTAESGYIAATVDARTSDDYQSVYSLLKVPADFDWSGIWPVAHPNGTVELGASGFPYFNHERTFSRSLPFRNLDWRTAETEFRRPFAAVRVPGDPDRWYYVHALKEADDAWSNAGLSPSDREAGVFLYASPRHLFGKNHVSGSLEGEALFDYEDVMFTLWLPTDAHLRAVLELAPYGVGGLGAGSCTCRRRRSNTGMRRTIRSRT